MIATAAEVLRERGAAGVTIDEVLARSGAPRGSVYHHFPGGKNQLLTEALHYAGDALTASIDRSADQGSRVLLAQFTEVWERLLQDSDFTAGCPVVAAAIGPADEEPQLTAEAGKIFGHWRAALAQAFAADGFDEPDATSLAVTAIAALEGAVVLCRASRTVAPLRDVIGQLEFLIKSREFVRRHGVPGRP
ncbi:TetR/AcrR family transcriptional regulator [Mycobacterium talmoniae]|uniref:TetR family transcriptional regulator n=1 Tax=Mycobacterium talmoniae TaxID=1858794 RepID=A0A1S1NGY9_9MYCO|nr:MULTISPECIES: TetR/AcrR family transcriptional regulator [Mycobacterium]OHV05037.1 TetR family transcriptional regulator [Mycobacterium talmoniae]TDH56839.1 TetR/AcrR family transcriptional regulator [Mycobacterium eburneum]